MYCPRCAAQNLDDAKFCRACGADIRLVPQALMGIPAAEVVPGKSGEGKRAAKKQKPATIDEGLKTLFKGFAFLLIFFIGLTVFRGAFWLTIWFIIPAFESIGEGIGQLIRARRESAQLTAQPASARARTRRFRDVCAILESLAITARHGGDRSSRALKRHRSDDQTSRRDARNRPERCLNL
jgi:hypothetical protein